MGVVAPCVLIEAPEPCAANASSDDVVVGRVLQADECLTRVGHGCSPRTESSVSIVQWMGSVDLCQSRREIRGCPRCARGSRACLEDRRVSYAGRSRGLSENGEQRIDRAVDAVGGFVPISPRNTWVSAVRPGRRLLPNAAPAWAERTSASIAQRPL